LDQDGSPHTLAFEMHQELPAAHHQRDVIRYLINISKIEHDMGLGFFPDFSIETRMAVGHDLEPRLW
jgi:hypothetical protein